MAIEQKLMTQAELRKQLIFGRDELPDLEAFEERDEYDRCHEPDAVGQIDVLERHAKIEEIDLEKAA